MDKQRTNRTSASTVSIITSTKNCSESLGATAQSIRGQDRPGVQWIVVDAASSDGTLEIIRDNQDVVSNWISEPDTGIYDAWNKACELVRGDWILFLGAGDVLASPRVLEEACLKLAQLSTGTVIAYGDVVTTLQGRKWERRGEVDLSGWSLHRPALPDHQGVFHRASLLQTLRFDQTYQVAADSKFLLQALRQGTATYLGMDICLMQPGGISAHPKYAFRIMRECIRLEADLGYRLPLHRKAAFILLSCTRLAAYRIGGAATVEVLARWKRFLVDKVVQGLCHKSGAAK